MGSQEFTIIDSCGILKDNTGYWEEQQLGQFFLASLDQVKSTASSANY